MLFECRLIDPARMKPEQGFVWRDGLQCQDSPARCARLSASSKEPYGKPCCNCVTRCGRRHPHTNVIEK
jgi:hypothetical protein